MKSSNKKMWVLEIYIFLSLVFLNIRAEEGSQTSTHIPSFVIALSRVPESKIENVYSENENYACGCSSTHSLEKP